jgi:hypothetical protein
LQPLTQDWHDISYSTGWSPEFCLGRKVVVVRKRRNVIGDIDLLLEDISRLRSLGHYLLEEREM